MSNKTEQQFTLQDAFNKGCRIVYSSSNSDFSFGRRATYPTGNTELNDRLKSVLTALAAENFSGKMVEPSNLNAAVSVEQLPESLSDSNRIKIFNTEANKAGPQEINTLRLLMMWCHEEQRPNGSAEVIQSVRATLAEQAP